MQRPAPTPDRHVPAAGTPSASRAVAQFVLTGLLALAVFLAGSLLVLRSLGQTEALRDARQFALLSGQGIVEPELGSGLLAADTAALERLDRIVQERVLGERVVRVKIWTAAGRIVYSDEPRLIGLTYPLDDDKLEVLRTGATRAELSDLSGPENRYERGQGDLGVLGVGCSAQCTQSGGDLVQRVEDRVGVRRLGSSRGRAAVGAVRVGRGGVSQHQSCHRTGGV